MKTIVAAALLVSFSVTAYADGPFGVSMGDPISKFPNCKPTPGKEPGFYYCSSLPKSHPEFKEFIIQAFPETGVCFVKSLGSNIRDGGNGTQTKQRMAEIEEQLTAKYGKPESHLDYVERDGAIADEQFWVMTIKDNQRSYATRWMPPAGNESNLETIVLVAKALDYSTTYVLVEYAFTNNKRCDAIAKKSGASAL